MAEVAASHSGAAPPSSAVPISSLVNSSPAASPRNDAASPLPVLEPQEPTFEPDEAEIADNASSIDDRLSSYTASLTSSVVDYPMEYGRRYHAFRSGSYMLPNDEPESERLDMAHAVMTRAIGNRLHLAPIKVANTHRILDIGTGTGIWAMEMSDYFPNAEVVGNDLSAIQPTWVPPNVKFEIDDVESAWVGDRKYDYIMCRYMSGSIGDWPRLVKQIFNNLNPGGWVEFQDFTLEVYSDDKTMETEGKFTFQWSRKFIEALDAVGREPCPGPKLEGWVRDHGGFDHITHQKFKVPIGPWAKDQHYKDVGLLNLAQILQGLEGASVKLFCSVLGWTTEELLALTANVRKEIKNSVLHSMFDFHVVYAQKPLDS